MDNYLKEGFQYCCCNASCWMNWNTWCKMYTKEHMDHARYQTWQGHIQDKFHSIHNSGLTILNRVFNFIVTMCHIRCIETRNARCTWRVVWKPYKRMILSLKHPPNRVLLTFFSGWLHKDGKILWTLPTSLKLAPCTPKAIVIYYCRRHLDECEPTLILVWILVYLTIYINLFEIVCMHKMI